VFVADIEQIKSFIARSVHYLPFLFIGDILASVVKKVILE